MSDEKLGGLFISACRAPINKYGEMLAAVTGLFFFSTYCNPYE